MAAGRNTQPMLFLRAGNAAFGRNGDDMTALAHRGVRCERAGSGQLALELLRLYQYDLLLLNTRLPDMAPHQLLAAMRAAKIAVPVLALSADPSAESRVTLLDGGADDVLPAPCDMDELVARARAVLRRGRGEASSALSCGGVELCLGSRQVRVLGRALRLSRREHELLELLFLKRGALVRRESILNHLYGSSAEADLKVVDVIVCRLRKKLTQAGAADIVRTSLGGYLLDGPDTVAPAPARSSMLSLFFPDLEPAAA
jgi:two-component system cell cycle response regulator CtrA